MLAPLLDGIRADINQQIGWAKTEVRRQTRHTVVIGVLAAMATLAALGSIIVGLIALYFWLAPQVGPYTALSAIGGGLLLIALMLFVLVLVWRRPRVASRPPLQITRPAALFGTFREGSRDKVIARSDETLKVATSRRRSHSALLGTLGLAAIVGLIAGRRLRLRLRL